MIRVMPNTHENIVPIDTPPAEREFEAAVGGILYLIGTVVLSCVYLVQIQSSLTNDYWWPDFNSTGVQTFLGDVYNSHLVQGRAGRFRLLNGGVVYATKSYVGDDTRIEWSASYARQILLDDIPLEMAVAALRLRTLEANTMNVSPYCWLDFNRTFGMAHTLKRQARCEASKQDNAAVYFESLTRNCEARGMYITTQSHEINVTILATLRQSVEGQWWIHAMDTRKPVSVADEVLHWTSKGLTRWKTNLQNLNHDGIDDSITIRSALGYEQSVQIKKMSVLGRSTVRWTTLAAYAGVCNDLYMCASRGASVLLHANNSFANLGIDWDLDILDPPDTVGAKLVRRVIGPFLSIDVELVPPPPILISLFREFQQLLSGTYQSRRLSLPDDATVDPVPRSWQGADRVYYGGNPVCPFGSGKPFIQPSFGYYDDCTAEVPHSLQVSPAAGMFALFVASPMSILDFAAKSCALCSSGTSTACERFVLDLASQRPRDSLSNRTEIYEAAISLELAFIQLASDNTSSFVLTQPMVSMDPVDPWALFGWVMVYDWLQGDREAIRFEGDEGTVTLLTQPHPTKFSIVANPMDIPSHACKYFWYISVYVTCMLGAVGLVAVAFGVLYRFDFDGWHFAQFNRVVGSVWIGRPFLVLRGMTAIVIMSTVRVAFVQDGGISVFERNRRSFFETIMVASEGIWLTYVFQDLFTPVTSWGSGVIQFSTVVVWCVYAMLDMDQTLELTATIHRTCEIEYVGHQISCKSGTVEIGSVYGVGMLSAISAGIPAVIMLSAMVCNEWKFRDLIVFRPGIHALVPAAALSYLRVGAELDPVASVMCGMLHLRQGVFDIKVWRVFGAATSAVAPEPAVAATPPKPAAFGTRRRLLSCLGLAYMIGTVVVSYSYLVVTDSTMTNDFWWTSFNSTGHQSFLTNWFNRQLLVTSAMSSTQIDKTKHADVVYGYDSKKTPISTAPMYPASIQDEVYSDLQVVVQGLRAMDSCDLPWIAASYCYVDFGQTWEMAVSAGRQDKCRLDQQNGAVYLESILRNADWTVLKECWGDALTSGVFNAVGRTSKGQEWVAAMTSDISNSVPDEVSTWMAHNVTTYSPQWQNYKQIGVTETIDLQNAFGVAYPLTIRKHPSVYRSGTSLTSYRMQWPLAKLLWAITTNSSGVGGLSLVRSSPAYAFTNSSSIEHVLARNRTLELPLSSGLSLTRLKFGPFGTTAMKRIPPPLGLRTLYGQLTAAIAEAAGQDAATVQAYSSIRYVSMFSPHTAAWRGQCHVGGNLMCDLGNAVNTELAEFFALDGSCSVYGIDQTLNDQLTTMAAVLSQASRTDIDLVHDTCGHETAARTSCQDLVQQGLAFLNSTIPASQRAAIAELAQATRRTLQATIAPQIVQFTRDCTNESNVFALSHLGVFDEPSFEFFAWLYMFEWVLGYREVVQFDGDLASMTVVSGRPLMTLFEVNDQEIPLNVAFYCRRAMQYFTVVLLLVAIVVCVTIVVSRGYIEGMNMFEFNRVAALVWIGRPLLFLRGVTAMCILSTATLHLDLPTMQRGFTQLVSVPPDPVTTLLSCGEMGWIVYILNDVFSVVTTDITAQYAWKSSTSVWLAAGVWSLVSPVEHAVSIDRQCVANVVDYTLTCRSATFEIGRVDRFVGLFGLACLGCVVCYIIERLLLPHRQATKTSGSLLLHSVAQYQFDQTQWQYGDVYFLDRASAVLNGLLSFQTTRGDFVVMDIKTWQWFIIPRHKSSDLMPQILGNALPLAKASFSSSL